MRVTGIQAKEILREEIAKFSSRIDFSMDVKHGPRLEANELSWWLNDLDDTESATTDRNKAFLRTYKRIGGERLYAPGLALADRGRVYMDRSVMRRLHRDGFVEFHKSRECYFTITAKGAQLVEA